MSAQKMQEAMEQDGLRPAQQIIADGRPHRIKDLQDTAKDSRMFYVCFGDAGYYMHHARLIEGRKWSAKRETEFTPEEKRDYAIKMQQAIELRRKEEEQRHTECRERSAIIWDNAPLAPNNHPYLVKKGVTAYELKLHKGRLVVPVYDVEDTLHGLQYIGEDGGKKFEPGTAVKGNFSYIVGDKEKPLYICEGWATGATIHAATGATVIIAFACGNLKPVAEAVRVKVGGESCR